MPASKIEKVRKTVKAHLAFLIALATSASVAASSPSFVPQVAGVYKARHEIAVYDGSQPPGPLFPVEDVLEIAATRPNEAYIRVHMEFANGHICGLHGIAKLEGDALVYRPVDGPQHCVVSLRKEGAHLVFHDPDDTCRPYYCGMHGRLEGASFALSSRRSIRYMKRLLASREYGEATAERDGRK